ncbi:hypothetical protein EMCRGX_G026364 [Ephydatia muelleri]
MATSYNGKLNHLKIHATVIDGTIEELQQLEPSYSVITHMGSMDDNVQEYRAVVSNCSELVHSGDYVELHPPFCEFKYGQLLTTIKLKSGRTLCLVQGFLAMQLPNGQPLLNDYECPLFTLSRTLFSVDSTRIQKAISMVHECGNHCKFERSGMCQKETRPKEGSVNDDIDPALCVTSLLMTWQHSWVAGDELLIYIELVYHLHPHYLAFSITGAGLWPLLKDLEDPECAAWCNPYQPQLWEASRCYNKEILGGRGGPTRDG